MSRPQDSHRPVLRFVNPFRVLLPKGSNISPKHLSLVNAFEDTLLGRIEKLNPVSNKDVLQLSWLTLAMKQLCAIHEDVKTLIGDLELPVTDWTEKWIELYFDNSVKLLDISNFFTSEICRLEESHLHLRIALQHLCGTTSDKLVSSRSSLDTWKQHVGSKSPSLDQCLSVMEGLSKTFGLPKVESSDKEKVLIRAMHGVQVVTVLVCSVFAAFCSGSAGMLTDLQVSDTYSWAKSFLVLQTCVNTEMRKMFSSGEVILFKELRAIDACARKLFPVVRGGLDNVEADVLVNVTSEIRESSEAYSQGLSLLSKEVRSFSEALLSGRNVLVGKLSVTFDPAKATKNA